MSLICVAAVVGDKQSTPMPLKPTHPMLGECACKAHRQRFAFRARQLALVRDSTRTAIAAMRYRSNTSAFMCWHDMSLFDTRHRRRAVLAITVEQLTRSILPVMARCTLCLEFVMNRRTELVIRAPRLTPWVAIICQCRLEGLHDWNVCGVRCWC